MKQEDRKSLPACSMSGHCLRLVDDLDQPSTLEWSELSFTDDSADERLVEQLREHVPTCPTCTATLAQARRIRTQQRIMLYNLLLDSEQKVPSTTAQIFAVMQQEPRTFQPSDAGSKNGKNHQQQAEKIPIAINIAERRQQKQRNRQDQPERRSQVIIRNTLALAAVASLILAAVGIFSRYNFIKHPTAGTTASGATAIVGIGGWSSVIIGLAFPSKSTNTTGAMTVANYDPVNKRSASLATVSIPANAGLDGISHQGQYLLYHYASGDGRTHYHILSQATDRPLFTTPGQGSKGVWSTDDTFVYIGTASTIAEFSIQAATLRTIISSLHAPQPQFYRNGYLYFENAGELYRVNTTSGVQQPIVQKGTYSSFTDYLLSPDRRGSTLYYVDRTPGGAFGIHSVNNDGTNTQDLRQDPGAMLLGFAGDIHNSLMFMQQTAPGKYAVVKLGATQPQDETILDDAAPGALSIDEANTALAPYAHGLIVTGIDQDGTRTIWFDNLDTHTSTILLQPGNDVQVQIPGWDRLVVPETASTPTVEITPTPVSTARAFDSWNEVAKLAA